MAKALIWWLLLGSLVQARPPVVRLKVWRNGSRIHVRVTAHNPDRRWHGPFTMNLKARRAQVGPWIPLRTWKSVPPLGPGHRVSREFFQEQSVLLRALSATGPLQLRASIDGPGFQGSQELIDYLPGR